MNLKKVTQYTQILSGKRLSRQLRTKSSFISRTPTFGMCVNNVILKHQPWGVFGNGCLSTRVRSYAIFVHTRNDKFLCDEIAKDPNGCTACCCLIHEMCWLQTIACSRIQ